MSKLPIYFERVEGAILFVAMSGLFFALHGGLITYVLVLLAVDISIAGYLAGPKVGAITYNLFHNLAGPIILLGIGILSVNTQFLSAWALVWIAHIGVDRALGLGLKYPDGFGHTTLGRIGRHKN
jgi:hypothetical protein